MKERKNANIPERRGRVLVLGSEGDTQITLAIIRSLGRAGITVHLGRDKKEAPVCSYSRYIDRTIPLPSSSKEEGEWVESLKCHLTKNDYDLIIPVSDPFLVPIVKHREYLEDLGEFAIPDDYGFDKTHNKSDTYALADQLEIPYPKSYYINSLDQVETVLRKMCYPIVIKPISSRIWRDKQVVHSVVRYAHNEDQLKAFVSNTLKIVPVLLQSFVFGKGVGQEFLMREGELCAAFQHERIHERIAGGSSYRKSAELDSELSEYSLKLLRELNWTGVAMVEYRVNKETRDKVLMEVNGRFWGSLPLAIASGVDFPRLLYEMLVNNKIPHKIEYQKGIYGRSVGDLGWVVYNLRNSHSNPYLSTLPWGEVMKEVFNILTFREHYDALTSDDLLPGIVQPLTLLNKARKHLTKKFMQHILEKYYGRAFSNSIYNKSQVIELISKKPSTLFVCKGNICRSPFAEFYLMETLDKRGIKGITVQRSAGLIMREGRRSPALAIQAARKFGVDLTEHRSRYLSEEMINQSGVIFVMDIPLYFQIKHNYQNAQDKTFLLGAFSKDSSSSLEIKDPYNQNLEKFIKTFTQITESIEDLVLFLQQNGGFIEIS